MVNTVESEFNLGNLLSLCIVLLFFINVRATIILIIIFLLKLELCDMYCHLIIQIMLQNQVGICKMSLMYENYRVFWVFPIHN